MLLGERLYSKSIHPPVRALAGLAVSLILALHLIQPVFASDEDMKKGEKLFRACKGCHEIGEGARNKVGPHLDGLIGRVAGSMEGFKYSRAMKDAGRDGLIWSRDALFAFLEKPREFVRGNRMSFRGMASAEDREKLIAFLEIKSKLAPSSDGSENKGAQLTGFAQIVMQMDGDPAFGEYLAGDCVTCHQVTGHADGIPSIVGVPKEYFIQALFEYKNNIRTNEVMKLRVANLSNEEIAALAAYFSGLEPQ